MPNASPAIPGRGGKDGTGSAPDAACDHPGCSAAGLYRAPKARDRLRDYYSFCLEHVRAYNGTWDYCRGLREADIEALIRAAICWERPDWKLGDRQGPWRRNHERLRPDDPFGPIGGAADRFGKAGAAQGRRRADSTLDPALTKALAVLDLSPPVRWAEIKARYKRLAKRYHPDANGGDKTAEDRLKMINGAYHILKGRAVP